MLAVPAAATAAETPERPGGGVTRITGPAGTAQSVGPNVMITPQKAPRPAVIANGPAPGRLIPVIAPTIALAAASMEPAMGTPATLASMKYVFQALAKFWADSTSTAESAMLAI